ncbi:MAG: radical SAM protein [Candidatus Omnitrophota bacterium]|jgi:radical SAM superfamily enzyme YgiQ (UPF0313 family)
MRNAQKQAELVLVMCPLWGVSQPPISISYLSGFLQKHGVSVRCFDFSSALYRVFPEKKCWDLNFPEYFMSPELFNRHIKPVLNPVISDWAGQILALRPSVVGFSLFMSNMSASLLLAQELKKRAPDLLIVAGGCEVTRIKRIYVDGIQRRAHLDTDVIDSGVFDLFIDGEGEQSLLEIVSLIRKNEDFHLIKGAVFRQNGKFVANPPQELMANLDIVPPPDFHDFFLDDYTRRSLPIVTSRGCVNRCTFCADSPLWKVYRYQSAEKVFNEFSFLSKEYGISDFEIVDSTFNGNIERVDKLCALIIKSGLKIRWAAKATLRKEMDHALLCHMQKAGCVDLAYGVESGSYRVLQDMRKNTDLLEIKRIIRDTWKAKIRVNSFFLIGYPTETEDDFQLTLDFVKENARYIHRFDQITGCHLEEDSYLSLNAQQYGIEIKDDGWWSPVSTPAIRKDRLNRFRELARKLHAHYRCEVQL